MSFKYSGDGASHPQSDPVFLSRLFEKGDVTRPRSVDPEVSDIKISKQAPPDVAESGNAARTWDSRLFIKALAKTQRNVCFNEDGSCFLSCDF